MVIFIALPDVHTIILKVEAYDTIDNAKTLTTIEEGIPQKQQRLIFAGKELENDATLSDNNILNKYTLTLREEGIHKYIHF